MSGKFLHLFQATKAFSTKTDDSKKPSEWKVEHYANVGTNEEFVRLFAIELPDLVGGSLICGLDERQRLNESIATILIEGLLPAFEHLKKIRASRTQQLPKLNRMQLYEDFTRVLWHGYKDLMPKAALLLGFDIGFLFQTDTKFEKGVVEFNKKHPSLVANICDFLRTHRKNWQSGLGEFRNLFLEHRQYEQSEFADFYNPDAAELLFALVWETTVSILVVFIEATYPPMFSIEFVPEDERDPSNPRWFKFVLLNEPLKR